MDPYVLEHHRPKLLVWQLTPAAEDIEANGKVFSTHECLLTIDSIVRTAKPIVVLTGHDVVHRPDLFSIIEYGVALGLKMIVEVRPSEVDDQLIRKFSSFGPRIFRVIVDGCIKEDQNTRYQDSDDFRALEQTVQSIRNAGLEVHLGTTVLQPDVRQLAFDHDFALTRSAAGFYCHFCFDNPEEAETGPKEIEEMIAAVATMKGYSPRNMYFSPQCIRYEHRQAAWSGTEEDNGAPARAEWNHWCLGGKTFGYISATGDVQICAGIGLDCGNLREHRYEFRSIWYNSDVMKRVREQERSCTETRELFLGTDEPEPTKAKG